MTHGPEFPEGAGGVKTQDKLETASLAEAILGALGKSGITWLRRVTVEASGGDVVLRGTVPNYYLKQLAQETAMAMPGVGLVRNELQVGGGR